MTILTIIKYTILTILINRTKKNISMIMIK